MIEIKTIDGGQKDALLRRANVKKMQSMADVFGTQNAPHLKHKQNVFLLEIGSLSNWFSKICFAYFQIF